MSENNKWKYEMIASHLAAFYNSWDSYHLLIDWLIVGCKHWYNSEGVTINNLIYLILNQWPHTCSMKGLSIPENKIVILDKEISNSHSMVKLKTLVENFEEISLWKIKINFLNLEKDWSLNFLAIQYYIYPS